MAGLADEGQGDREQRRYQNKKTDEAGGEKRWTDMGKRQGLYEFLEASIRRLTFRTGRTVGLGRVNVQLCKLCSDKGRP